MPITTDTKSTIVVLSPTPSKTATALTLSPFLQTSKPPAAPAVALPPGTSQTNVDLVDAAQQLTNMVQQQAVSPPSQQYLASEPPYANLDDNTQSNIIQFPRPDPYGEANKADAPQTVTATETQIAGTQSALLSATGSPYSPRSGSILDTVQNFFVPMTLPKMLVIGAAAYLAYRYFSKRSQA